jgi:hypothetical protein
VRNLTKPGNAVTSAFVLYTTGQLTLNRGYLRDAGVVRDPVGLETRPRLLSWHFVLEFDARPSST